MADVTVTSANVTNLLGITGSDQATTHATLITSLIERMLKHFLEITGRSAEKITLASKVFTDGAHCEVEGSILHLKGKYQDILSITAISDAGTALTESTAYNDGNDYILDIEQGTITKVDGTSWSKEANAIVISGYFGIGTLAVTDFTLRADVVQVVTVLVCVATGLWTQTILTPDGQLDATVIKIPDETKTAIERLKAKF